MLRSDVLYALQAYTRLPSPVQGVLEKRGQNFEFGAGLTRDKGFDRALRNIDVDVFCVKRLRILRSLTEPARVVEGSFVLRGKVVALEHGVLGVASVIAGQLPPEASGASNSYLLELREEDVVPCASPQQLPFGVNVSTESLAPRWNYVSAVFSRKIDRALVACASGLFTIQAAPSGTSKLSPEAAEQLLQNLVDLDLVAEAAQTPPSQPRVLYRVARNCIFVGDEASGQQVLELQRQLQLSPTTPPTGRMLPTAISGFSLDAGIVSVQGPRIELQALQEACPQGVAVSRQSLGDWWLAPNAVTFEVRLLGPPSLQSDASVLFRAKLQPTEQMHWEVSSDVQAPPLRDLRPGETKYMLKGQLQSLVHSSLAAATSFRDMRDVSQKRLDQATKELSEGIEKGVRESGLFSQEITVEVKASLHRAPEGPVISLPSGDRVALPPYSYEAGSPRLNAYLGVFSTLGLQGAFRSWDHALKNKILAL